MRDCGQLLTEGKLDDEPVWQCETNEVHSRCPVKHAYATCSWTIRKRAGQAFDLTVLTPGKVDTIPRHHDTMAFEDLLA